MEKFESGQECVPSTEVHGLEVAVTGADGKQFVGRLLELHTDDAEASFPRDSGPTLRVGSLETLIISAPWLRAPIEVSAQVLSRVEADTLRTYRYRLKFDSEELKRRLSREARRVQNQRTANRVQPVPGERVVVELKPPAEQPDGSLESSANVAGDVSATGRLKDISTGGVGVFLSRKAENMLAATELVELSVELPPSTEPLKLMGWIRHRRLKGNRMSYGIEFDTELSNNFAPQLDKIIQYIVRCEEQEQE
jgi:hypothetical protein